MTKRIASGSVNWDQVDAGLQPTAAGVSGAVGAEARTVRRELAGQQRTLSVEVIQAHLEAGRFSARVAVPLEDFSYETLARSDSTEVVLMGIVLQHPSVEGPFSGTSSDGQPVFELLIRGVVPDSLIDGVSLNKSFTLQVRLSSGRTLNSAGVFT